MYWSEREKNGAPARETEQRLSEMKATVCFCLVLNWSHYAATHSRWKNEIK